MGKVAEGKFLSWKSLLLVLYPLLRVYQSYISYLLIFSHTHIYTYILIHLSVCLSLYLSGMFCVCWDLAGTSEMAQAILSDCFMPCLGCGAIINNEKLPLKMLNWID